MKCVFCEYYVVDLERRISSKKSFASEESICCNVTSSFSFLWSWLIKLANISQSWCIKDFSEGRRLAGSEEATRCQFHSTNLQFPIFTRPMRNSSFTELSNGQLAIGGEKKVGRNPTISGRNRRNFKKEIPKFRKEIRKRNT